MKKKLQNLSITRVALVPKGSNPKADIVLFKSKPDDPPTSTKESVFMKKNIDTSKLSASEVASLTALLEKSATDIPDTAPASDPTPAIPTDVMKSLPAEVQAFIKATEEKAEQARKDAEAALQTATIEKAAREESDFVTRNTAMVKSYPGKADENAKLLFVVSKALKPADYAKLETLIKAGSAALEQAQEPVGDDDDNPVVSNAAKALKEKADEIRKNNPKMSGHKAFEQACAENMDLVQQARGIRPVDKD